VLCADERSRSVNSQVPSTSWVTLGLSLRARIVMSALLPVLAITLYFAQTFYAQKQFARTTHDILDRRLVMMHAAEQIKQSLIAYDDALFRYLAIQDPTQLSEGLRFKKSTQEKIDQLQSLSPSPVLQQRLVTLEQETGQYFEDASKLLEFSRKSRPSPMALQKESSGWSRDRGQQRLELAFLSEEGKARLIRVFALCDEVITVNRLALEQAQVDMDALLDKSRRTGIIVSVLSIGVLGFLAASFLGSLLGPLRRLLDGIRQVEKGDLSIEIPVTSSDELGEVAEAFNRATHLIRQQREQLIRETITDGLTGAYNHRHFQKILRQEMERARRSHEPVSILMLDLDHFKNYNDTFGHEYGNEILKQVCASIRDNIREVDILARYGGDEFAVVLPQAGPEMALQAAKRILDAVETYASRILGKDPSVPRLGLSIGGASFPNDAESVEVLVHRADEALYEAKSAGRGRIYWAKPA